MAPGTPAELLLTPFGKYTLLSRLSYGGMAELFLAVQHFALGFQKLVVVKRILPARRDDPTFVDMFLREARIAASLSHPNVVQTLDAGELDGTYFIVMEYVSGEDLRSILRAIKQNGEDAVPLEHALQIALGACAGLAYVHERRDLDGEELRIVHGDISTHNVILSFGGDVKIVDFGIATSDGTDDDAPDSRRIKGKPRYMSPEQAAGLTLDARTDIYSLGVVLFELTTGRRLFQGNGPPSPDDTRNPAYARPTDAAPGYPPALERILLRALEPNREARYPTARAMQADLEEFIKAEGIPVSSLSTSAWMRSTFEEKIVREQEALRGIDDLVTTVGTREELLQGAEAEVGGSMGAACAVGGSIAPHAMAATGAPKWPLGSVLVPIVSVVAAIGAVVYVRHDASLRLAQAARAIRVEAAPPALGQATSEVTGSVEIVTRPEGCAVAIEGVPRAESTPAKIDRLPVGRELHVTVTKDGYDPLRTTVTISADALFKEVELELKKRAATLVIQFPPPVPVDVWLDGKRYTGDRTRIEGLTPDRDHVVGFSAQGYEPRSYRVSLQPGQTKALNVSMPKVQAAEPE